MSPEPARRCAWSFPEPNKFNPEQGSGSANLTPFKLAERIPLLTFLDRNGR
jgi:hypothetical protein